MFLPASLSQVVMAQVYRRHNESTLTDQSWIITLNCNGGIIDSNYQNCNSKILHMKALGIILIVAGILMMVFRGVSFTREKKLIDLGPLQINKKEKETLGWPMYAGAIATVAGVVLLVSGRRRS